MTTLTFSQKNFAWGILHGLKNFDESISYDRMKSLVEGVADVFGYKDEQPVIVDYCWDIYCGWVGGVTETSTNNS